MTIRKGVISVKPGSAPSITRNILPATQVDARQSATPEVCEETAVGGATTPEVSASSSQSEQEGAGSIVYGTITSEQTNTISVRRADDNVIVSCAKPEAMRGAVNTRTVGSEVHYVTPPYTAGTSVIMASDLSGGTGISGVTYIDITPGRFWGYDEAE